MIENPVIVGCGYVGIRLARLLKTRGAIPLGLVRSMDSARRLQGFGIEPLVANLDDRNTLGVVSSASSNSRVFYFAPPPAVGESDAFMNNFIEICDRIPPKRILYISTSGVYGDCKGAWVNETRPPNPQTARAKRRWHAEQSLMAWREKRDVEFIILRVGGIYGPGRLPLSRLAKTTLICPDEAPYSNRIHVDDLVQVCAAADRLARSGEIFNVADGHPTTMTDYFYRVAELADVPKPPCVPLEDAAHNLSPTMLSYVRESRRLDITKLKRELKVDMRYSNLTEGLRSCTTEIPL